MNQSNLQSPSTPMTTMPMPTMNILNTSAVKPSLLSSTLPSKSPTPPTGYKQILLYKLSYAVTCSVVSQLIVLFAYIFALNFSVFTPLASIGACLGVFQLPMTWAYIATLALVVFAQSIVCAKDYILTPRYCSTRLARLKAVASLRNLVLLNLHVAVGFLYVLLFLGFTHLSVFDPTLYKYVLVEKSLYLLYLGAWSGLLYFINVHTREKKVMFPVVQQLKWVQFKSHLLPLVKRSQRAAFWPTLYFIIAYAMVGRRLNELLPLQIDAARPAGDWVMYALAWFFASMIYFSLNLMHFYYELFLTEPLAFPLVGLNNETFTLRDAIATNVPIIQHLACQDVFLLAANSAARREELFTLSTPGNHPHNWNHIAEALLRILRGFTDRLNASLNKIAPEKKSLKSTQPPKPAVHQELHGVNMQLRMRRLGSPTAESVNIATINPIEETTITTVKETFIQQCTQRVDKALAALKERTGINFMCRELPEASIQACLGDGQVIVWVCQALSILCTRSLDEDRYGIVQKDLPAIMSALVELKLALEKLARVPALHRNKSIASSEDFNGRMRLAVLSATKRSIYSVVEAFAPYLKDLNLRPDVVAQLQLFAVRTFH